MWFWRVTLRRGSHGPAVADVRRRLFRLGYLHADGGNEFDESCRAAVVAFQAAHTLRQDGVVGPETWLHLHARRLPTGACSSVTRSVWAPPVHATTAQSTTANISISVSQRTLTLHDGSGHTRTFPVAVGRELSPTPTGRFTVAELCPRPGGALGTRWLRLHPATCCIHGTDEPWTIGANVTPGCVRMHNKDAEIIFHRVHAGAVVLIQP